MPNIPSRANNDIYFVFLALAIDESFSGNLLHLFGEYCDVLLVQSFEEASPRLRSHFFSAQTKEGTKFAWKLRGATYRWSSTSHVEVFGDDSIHQFFIVRQSCLHFNVGGLPATVSIKL